MQHRLAYGRLQLDLEIPEAKLVPARCPATAASLTDLASAVSAALEAPDQFPPLRRALTPDDHVALVVDEGLPHLPQLLMATLEHLASAKLAPSAVTIVCPDARGDHAWFKEMPTSPFDLRLVVHEPKNRDELAYLATTGKGRRIYLNRTVVEAEQVVLLARRGYHPLLGYSGAEALLFPGLADEETQQDVWSRVSIAAPGPKAWPVRQEAGEVGWLLGAPFVLEAIEGEGDDLVCLTAGTLNDSERRDRLLDSHWRTLLAKPAQTVVATLSGDPARHDFGALGQAACCAARVVEPGGSILVLSEAAPRLDRGAEVLRQADDPEEALKLLKKEKPDDLAAAFLWASAARRAKLYLLSALPGDAVEELFAMPLQNAAQVQRLVNQATSVVLLRDAHKALAVTE